MFPVQQHKEICSWNDTKSEFSEIDFGAECRILGNEWENLKGPWKATKKFERNRHENISDGVVRDRNGKVNIRNWVINQRYSFTKVARPYYEGWTAVH